MACTGKHDGSHRTIGLDLRCCAEQAFEHSRIERVLLVGAIEDDVRNAVVDVHNHAWPRIGDFAAHAVFKTAVNRINRDLLILVLPRPTARRPTRPPASPRSTSISP